MWNSTGQTHPFTYTRQMAATRMCAPLIGPVSPHELAPSRADLPSKLQFSNLSFVNWTGTANTNKSTGLLSNLLPRYADGLAERPVVDIECSPAVPCPGIKFADFNITPPSGTAPRYICKNVADIEGLSCTSATICRFRSVSQPSSPHSAMQFHGHGLSRIKAARYT